ncbi:TraY domain-containing protein [Roseburia hominis]
MPSQKPKIVVRTDGEIKTKFEIIAERNNRSASKEAEYLIKKHIEQYETYNGEIKLDKE